jgi:hypothetical protein
VISDAVFCLFSLPVDRAGPSSRAGVDALLKSSDTECRCIGLQLVNVFVLCYSDQ